MLFEPKQKLSPASCLSLAEEKNWLVRPSEQIISTAFPSKKAVHAGMTGEAVPLEQRESLLDELRAQKRQGACAAYVHIPYCQTCCLYCGFFGGKYTKTAGKKYLDVLLEEIRRDSATACVQGSPVNAVYLGGGTPTALEAEELHLLLSTLRECLPLANDCEITVEGRVHNFDKEKMEACLNAGANRFSFGVQTFDTKLRQMIGRIEPQEKVLEQLALIASYNQAAIVIDLIYGLPGQSLQHWEKDLELFLALPIDGVDLYQLNVFPNSALEKAISAGKVPPTVPLHQQGDYFLAGIEKMQGAGLRRLSISHWGKGARERNLYNPMAKTRTDCLQFGVRAGGALHGYFIANEFKDEDYFAQCKKGKKPVAMLVGKPANFDLVKSILGQMEHCSLDMGLLDKALLQTSFKTLHLSAKELFAPLLDNWEQAGLVVKNGQRINLTLAGQFWQVNLTHALVGWQNLIFQECYK